MLRCFPLLVCVLLFSSVYARAGVFNPVTSAELIAAMNTSNTNNQADVINLTARGTYTLLTVDNSDDYGANGLPIIADDVEGIDLFINGRGATITRSTVSGTPDFRILQIANPNAAANISGLTISNGVAVSPTGGFQSLGGGILNWRGTLNLNNSTISNNTANDGGGIFNMGSTSIVNSTISNNVTPYSIGAGITNSGTLTIRSSTISNNTAAASGGGIFNMGSTSIVNSTISNNTAADGSGGGILNESNLSVRSSTVTGNRAATSGIFLSQSGGGIAAFGTETLTNTIVAGNLLGPRSTPDDINNTVETANFNLIGDAASSGGIVNGTNGNIVGNNGTGTRAINTILNPTLADNGGPTLTHALVTGSPALDAGSTALALTVDQRGAPRPFDGDGNSMSLSDIGAVEQGSTPKVINLVVNKTADTNDGLCAASDCSLREAISAANVIAGDNTITFDIAGTGPHTITLNSALPDLSTNINIDNDNAGAEAVTVSRNTAVGTPAFRIFFIPMHAVTVSLSGLTISNGSAPVGGGIDNRGTLHLSNCTLSNNSAVGGSGSGTGGGIYNNGGSLKLSNSTLSNNSATNFGGGIYDNGGDTLSISGLTISNNKSRDGGGIYNSGGNLRLSDSTISNNSATASGGGIYNNGGSVQLSNSTLSNGKSRDGGGVYNNGGSLQLSNSTISNNSATAFGGGIYNNGGVDLSQCTLSGNVCDLQGGAIAALGGTVNILNSTISNNSTAGLGGGIINTGSLDVSSSTITGNRADSDGTQMVETGGGINAIGRERLIDTIVAGNLRGSGSTPDDINNGAIEAAISNLIGDAGTSGGITHGTNGNIVGNNGTGTRAINTILNPTLANNGGPTLTHALVDRSPAINKGNSTPATDQRGVVRPQGSNSDIGAYEAIQIEITDQTITEGDSGTRDMIFTVRLSTVLPVDVSFNYETINNASAKPGSDFSTSFSDSDGTTPGTLTIPAGQITGTITVPIVGDTINESSEVFYVLLSNASSGIFGKARGTGTITDDDRAPALSIGDVSLAEGNPAQGAPGTKVLTFPISLSAPSGQIVKVNFATANGIARSASDYVAKNGTLTFSPGVTTQTISININGDTLVEADETFYVILSNAVNASIGRGRGMGTIINDDNSG
jgi:CSLREA domain-containing protein